MSVKGKISIGQLYSHKNNINVVYKYIIAQQQMKTEYEICKAVTH